MTDIYIGRKLKTNPNCKKWKLIINSLWTKHKEQLTGC